MINILLKDDTNGEGGIVKDADKVHQVAVLEREAQVYQVSKIPNSLILWRFSPKKAWVRPTVL